MSLPIALGCIIAALVVGCILGGLYRKKVSEREIGSAEEKAKQIINDAYKSAESKRRETLLEAKEEIHKSRSEYEREVKERRAELQKQERRLQQKEETLDRKTDTLDKKTDALNQKIAAIDTKQNEINQLKKTQMELLEKISGYTVEEAKAFLINSLKDDVVHEQALMVKELENQYKDEADSRAREIIAMKPLYVSGELRAPEYSHRFDVSNTEIRLQRDPNGPGGFQLLIDRQPAHAWFRQRYVELMTRLGYPVRPERPVIRRHTIKR